LKYSLSLEWNRFGEVLHYLHDVFSVLKKVAFSDARNRKRLDEFDVVVAFSNLSESEREVVYESP